MGLNPIPRILDAVSIENLLWDSGNSLCVIRATVLVWDGSLFFLHSSFIMFGRVLGGAPDPFLHETVLIPFPFTDLAATSVL